MPGVPAPMVERAFRVLDILSVSEEGLIFLASPLADFVSGAVLEVTGGGTI